MLDILKYSHFSTRAFVLLFHSIPFIHGMSSTTPGTATLWVAPNTNSPEHSLCHFVLQCAQQAIEERGVFTVALSGGSIATFLASLPGAPTTDESTADAAQAPRYHLWHVIMADERCVPHSHPDSNYGALDKNLFSQRGIDHVYTIDESLLDDTNPDAAAAIARQYEKHVQTVLELSNGKLDLAVLGCGPDGHTCSLFPHHPLLSLSDTSLVASIVDSPKPPPQRITLTLHALNHKTRQVVFCGAGSSKQPILQAIFNQKTPLQDYHPSPTHGRHYSVVYTHPPPYPCAMVQPVSDDAMCDATHRVTWIVDAEAVGPESLL
jgi:6-phosphogluconolactonase